ncbi:DEAD/DEAH box helicase [Gloeobacter violaceus]|uniref:RNA helicase n=1 Tax=Gloeobacter violaceus (strain ATCC 29082 / PCC 7421) TaxID=251221 RepID=Q7NHM7_GLOVI|nr:DEAD/DEAH box helicase [Gloeobacter violaceus]BAC90449.1 gll2508 [Gloeobacter violaceus PCC 7421]
MATAFSALGLSESVVKALDELGFEQPTPIQLKSIPFLLDGRDLLAQAQTGTGKTAAFGLPLVDRSDPQDARVQALVLAPTRELAVQVCEAIHTYSKHSGVRVLPIYGGQPIDRQMRRLRAGAQIVVGTPGRVLDLMRRGSLDLSALRTLVLDEADQMLDMGFIEEVQTILDAAPPERQLVFFSATLPASIRKLAARHLRTPMTLTMPAEERDTPAIAQRVYFVNFKNRAQALTRVLAAEDPASALIFTRTKQAADELAEQLQDDGHRAEALHGDLNQSAREAVLGRFRRQQLNVVVATDVAARGLDIADLSHVINYDMPQDGESYIHRIGRTGRAGRTGVAISFALPTDRYRLRLIERATGSTLVPAKIPSAGEIQVRRTERLVEQLRRQLQADESDPSLVLYREVVGQLREEFDLGDIAATFLKLAQQRPGSTGSG